MSEIILGWVTFPFDSSLNLEINPGYECTLKIDSHYLSLQESVACRL
jgi:hypothetical protein